MNKEKRPVLCTTLYRKPLQPSNFDGVLYQLRHGIFSHGFHQKIRFKKTLRRDQKVIFVKSPISSLKLPSVLGRHSMWGTDFLTYHLCIPLPCHSWLLSNSRRFPTQGKSGRETDAGVHVKFRWKRKKSTRRCKFGGTK